MGLSSNRIFLLTTCGLGGDGMVGDDELGDVESGGGAPLRRTVGGVVVVVSTIARLVLVLGRTLALHMRGAEEHFHGDGSGVDEHATCEKGVERGERTLFGMLGCATRWGGDRGPGIDKSGVAGEVGV